MDGCSTVDIPVSADDCTSVGLSVCGFDSVAVLCLRLQREHGIVFTEISNSAPESGERGTQIWF